MKCVAGLAGLIVLLAAGPAEAQTAPATTSAQLAPVAGRADEATVSKWYLGILSGVQVVERAAPIVGGEFGIKVRGNLQVVVGGGRFMDVVTGSRVAEVASLANYIQQTQGHVATGDIDAPAWFGTVGLRYIYENRSGVRPYVLANAGTARVEYRPAFTLNGRNIASSVSEYGVTLGRDLLGPGYHRAYGGGAGLVFGDKWYLDVGVRLTRINTPDHATNVRRVSIGMGRRF